MENFDNQYETLDELFGFGKTPEEKAARAKEKEEKKQAKETAKLEEYKEKMIEKVDGSGKGAFYTSLAQEATDQVIPFMYRTSDGFRDNPDAKIVFAHVKNDAAIKSKLNKGVSDIKAAKDKDEIKKIYSELRDSIIPDIVRDKKIALGLTENLHVISDGELIADSRKIEREATSLLEEVERKKNYLNSIETENLSEEVLLYCFQATNGERLYEAPENPEYGIPQEQKYPLYDKHHVISAIRLFGHVEPKYEEQLAKAIISKMRKYDVPFDMVGKDNRLAKYLPNDSLSEEAIDERWFQRENKPITDKDVAKYKKEHPYLEFDDDGYIHDKRVEAKVEKDEQEQAEKEKEANKSKILPEFLKKKFAEKEASSSEQKEKTLKEDDEKTNFLNAVRVDLQGELKAIKDYDVHADTCEKAGYSDAAAVLRDIRDEEKVHIGELQKVLSKYDAEYEKSLNDGHEEASKELAESVLDPVHKERCPELWENNKLKPEIKKFIIDTLEEFRKQLNFELKVNDIYIIGSSTSYQYTDTSDIDVTVCIPEAFSDEDYDALVKIIPNGHNAPGTQHPVNYFFTAEFKEKNAENIYDLKTDSWIKDTPKEESELPTGYILQLSKFFMNSLDLTFGDYARDVQEYLEYKQMNPDVVEISEKERQEAMDRQMTKIKADLDSLRIGNHVIRGFMHEAYNSDDDQYTIHIEIENPNKDPRKSINNLVYKCLEKFGYRAKLDETIAAAEEFIQKESPSGEQLTESEDKVQEEFTETSEKNLETLKDAVFEMSKIKRGALIIILGKDDIFKNGSVIQDGTSIDWDIDKKKILNMFIVGTPLHDGAAIIKGDKLIKGAVFVEPTLTKMSGKFGARHQATKGITENSDAIAIIVSEETGDVSVAFDGELKPATEDNFIALIEKDFDRISRNSGKGYVVIRKLITDGKNIKISGVIHDKKDGDVVEGKDADIKGKVEVEPNKGNPLAESVTFIDNAGNLKTMSAENYNKDMHEYNTKTSIHGKRRFIIKKRNYKLRDDE